MSCMFLGNAHYTYLIDGMELYAGTPAVGKYFMPLCDKFLPNRTEAERIALGQRLLDANFMAYAGRYPSHVHEDIDLSMTVYTREPTPLTELGMFSLLKQAQCFSYQASGMDDWNTHPMNTEFLKPLLDALELTFLSLGFKDMPAVEQTPEYTSAPWGI